MNKLSKLSPLPYLSFLLLACSQEAKNISDQLQISAAPIQLKYSDTYQPPQFESDKRIENIHKLAPEITSIFNTHAEEQHFPGYVYGIVVDDSLVLSGSYGVINLDNQVKVNEQSYFKIASMTKSFTAMGIMKLKEEGKLDLNAPAQQYLPELSTIEYPTRDAAPITIFNLLTMTSGFPEDNPWGDRQLEDTNEEFLSFLSNGISMSNVPNEAFEYSNLGYAMLGNIISRVSGKPYQEYIRENIFLPLGMEDTYWEYEGLPDDQLAIGYRWEDEQWKPEPMLHDGAFGAMGGLITSLSDFSKYVSFHLSAWPPSNPLDNGPVKRSSLRQMQQMYHPHLFTDARDGQGNDCPVMIGYGFGLGIRKDCHGDIRVSHSGGLPGYGSEYRFYPEYGVGIISFANRTYSPAGSANARVMNLLIQKAELPHLLLPASEILSTRKDQVAELIQSWDEGLGEQILAENFYLDQSRSHRMAAAEENFQQIGNVQNIGELKAINQLRGTFVLEGDKGNAEVFFSLSPEKNPKVQAINIRLLD
ncbi:CubicO group peptidase (beta-lactamase class C family) [Catalinimonas alkaloidigena]|uniref:serine hydrolase domain-containing protein n=1 Tax=Catalinimonas alkaloidigena TaxID=1075417 RepID=UPI0024054578|nr:serine hydrolase domain-containing protein [Catalinimonas alkaloidigena]MDF9797442.1 CubicO group peptidase (beta-lactamase class C family) [Catalinimonas alkaloidigena]